MPIYRAVLEPQSALRTPWQADTLFGHLCWTVLFTQGEAALSDLLARFKGGDPPFLLSDGFPGDWLPRPMLPFPLPDSSPDKAAQISTMRAAKETKTVRWITVDYFNQLRLGQAQGPPTDSLNLIEHRPVLKNQINRLTGGTTATDEGDDDAGGNLYNTEELMYVKQVGVQRQPLDVSVYINILAGGSEAEVENLFAKLAQSGYGAKKSAGYGHFTLKDWGRYTGFDAVPEQANAFVSLSNWVPAQSDPVQGYYASMIKYGKLGETLANAEKPFKYPLLMLKAGSVFHIQERPKAVYGRLVEDIAPDLPEVVQYGYAFAVSARVSSDLI